MLPDGQHRSRPLPSTFHPKRGEHPVHHLDLTLQLHRNRILKTVVRLTAVSERAEGFNACQGENFRENKQLPLASGTTDGRACHGCQHHNSRLSGAASERLSEAQHTLYSGYTEPLLGSCGQRDNILKNCERPW